MTLRHLDWTQQWRAAALARPEEAHSLAEEDSMADAVDEDELDTESVALAFGDDVHGWPTAQKALDAFLGRQVVTADEVRSPEWTPSGDPSLAEESDDELTWILTSGGEVRGSVTAGRLPTGWVIQYYSRPA